MYYLRIVSLRKKSKPTRTCSTQKPVLQYIHEMKLELLETGKFYADGGAMFGAIPKTSWNRKYPSNDKNQCILSMRCALVSTDDGRKILIDTGAGDKQLQPLAYYAFFDVTDLGETLHTLGILPEEITDVVLTHLHFDHCGYVTRKNKETGGIVPAFPNATCWVSLSQWNNLLSPNPLEKDSYFRENLPAAEPNAMLRKIEEDTDLCSNVQLRLFDGHTPGQIAVYIRGKQRTAVFAGDVIPLAVSVSPGWISAYDTFPVTSYKEKIRMLDEAYKQKQIIIYCHDAYTPYSMVKKINCFYKAYLPDTIKKSGDPHREDISFDGKTLVF